MSLDLPPELEWALGFVGLPWPSIEEDQLREYATHLRTFASSLAATHGDARGTVLALSADNFGESIEAVVDRWGHASSAHLQNLVDACNGFADALEVAADGVVTAKLGIIAALTAMAAEFVADQAAAVATFGLAEFATVAIVGTTRWIVKGLLNQLEQVVIAEALQIALAPVESKLEEAVKGLALHGVEAALTQ
jgi:hypothetical protein